MKFEVEIVIVMLSVDYKDGQTYLITSEPDENKGTWIPNHILNEDDTDIEPVLHNLCKQYIDLDPEWINPQLSGVEIDEEDNMINLYYCGLIPYDTPLKDAKWIPTPQTELVSKALSKVM